jgi:outer membrane receptor protein involved in Fe transport
VYTQRVPTPGWDSFYVAGGSAIVALDAAENGFDTTDSPYVSRLTYDLTQIALFGEATYAATNRLDLTAGLRWYQWEEDKTFRSGGVYSNADAQNQVVSVDADGIAPRFLMSYDLADRWSVNAQISQGFRLGGVNDPLNQALCKGDYDTYRPFQEFKDETLWNYELGTKASLNGATVSGSIFYSDIEDLGVNADAGQCSSRVTISVPRAHTMGAELEVSVKPMEALLVTLAGSYVEAEFDSTIRTPDGSVVAGIRAGNRIPSVPDWQVSAAATYSLPGLFGADDGYVSASWQLVGERITQSGDQEPDGGHFPHELTFAHLDGSEVTDLDLVLDPYNLINISAGLSYETWELQFYVKNVTDENPKLSFDRERGGRARLGYRVGQPRTFGLIARMVF